MDFEVRAAGPGDEAVLARLAGLELADLTAERDGQLWHLLDARQPFTDLANAVRDESRSLAIASFEKLPVGFAHACRSSHASRIAVVEDLFVEAGFRELGVGEALMNHLVSWASEQGCVGIEAMALPGSREAKNFFERFGLKARRIVVYRRLDDGHE